MRDHFQLMADYNRWMNGNLHRAAAALPADALDAPRGAFFGSILGTLNHLVVADTVWLKRFGGEGSGGQSFYVVPRISDLPEIEDFLRSHVPEVSFVIAHGQMAATELEDIMNAFYEGQYDVLRERGCDLAQGYWLGYPMVMQDFMALLD